VIRECEEESLVQHADIDRVALVIRPKIKVFRLSKSLVDGGSTVSILFYDTFKHIARHGGSASVFHRHHLYRRAIWVGLDFSRSNA
jgi:hypothetical protein